MMNLVKRNAEIVALVKSRKMPRREIGARYGATNRLWVKVKTDGWRQANQFRHKMFEGNKKPEPNPHE
jgi:hypothetical protein